MQRAGLPFDCPRAPKSRRGDALPQSAPGPPVDDPDSELSGSCARAIAPPLPTPRLCQRGPSASPAAPPRGRRGSWFASPRRPGRRRSCASGHHCIVRTAPSARRPRRPSALACPLHADRCLLAQPGRALFALLTEKSPNQLNESRGDARSTRSRHGRRVIHRTPQPRFANSNRRLGEAMTSLTRPVSLQEFENGFLGLAFFQELVASAQASLRINHGATAVRLAEKRTARTPIPRLLEPGIFGPDQSQNRLGFRCVHPGVFGPARVAGPALDDPCSKGMLRARGGERCRRDPPLAESHEEDIRTVDPGKGLGLCNGIAGVVLAHLECRAVKAALMGLRAGRTAGT